MMFFCGNTPFCMAFNSQEALNVAKEIAEKEFAVVGVLEDLDDTFSALEAYVPRLLFEKTKF